MTADLLDVRHLDTDNQITLLAKEFYNERAECKKQNMKAGGERGMGWAVPGGAGRVLHNRANLSRENAALRTTLRLLLHIRFLLFKDENSVGRHALLPNDDLDGKKGHRHCTLTFSEPLMIK